MLDALFIVRGALSVDSPDMLDSMVKAEKRDGDESTLLVMTRLVPL